MQCDSTGLYQQLLPSPSTRSCSRCLLCAGKDLYEVEPFTSRRRSKRGVRSNKARTSDPDLAQALVSERVTFCSRLPVFQLLRAGYSLTSSTMEAIRRYRAELQKLNDVTASQHVVLAKTCSCTVGADRLQHERLAVSRATRTERD